MATKANRNISLLQLWHRFGSGKGIIGRLLFNVEVERFAAGHHLGRKKNPVDELIEAVDELKAKYPHLSDAAIIRGMLAQGAKIESWNPQRLQQHIKTWRNRLSRARRTATKKLPQR